MARGKVHCGRRINRGWIRFRADVEDCVRCGGHHEGLLFRRLSMKSVVDNVEHTHWTVCPTTDEPFLLCFVPQRTQIAPAYTTSSGSWSNHWHLDLAA